MLTARRGPAPQAAEAACSTTRRGSRGGVPARKISREEMDELKTHIRGTTDIG